MGDAQDDEERKRQRRERAAAWAAQQALKVKSEEAAAPSASSAPGAAVAVKMEPSDNPLLPPARAGGSLRWVRGGDLPKETDSSQVKEEASVGNKRQRTGWDSGQGKEAATPGDSGWMSWASQQVQGQSSEGGGRREDEPKTNEDEPNGYKWREMSGGIGALAGSYGKKNSATAIAAEEERILEEADDDYYLPRNHQPRGYIDTHRCEIASMDTPIPESNLGRRLLLKLGWKGYGGLGRDGGGIVDPIPLSSKDMLDLHTRVGVGRAEEEQGWHEAATASRTNLESEIQATETEERKKAREEKVAKESLIREEIKEIVNVFYCEVCNKQYTNDAQFQEHLNSYDHHHKKRFAEFKEGQKAMKGGPTAQERQRKEEKRMAKEIAARSAALQAMKQVPPPSSCPLSTDVPAAPVSASSSTGPIKIGMSLKSNKAKVGGGSLGSKKPAPKPMAFGGDDSD